MSDTEHESLEWAVKNGDLQQVQVILSQKKEMSNQPFPSGRYPLVVAADYGQAEMIQYLVSNGADVNVADKYGITPLLAAIYENHIDSVKLLLQKGANKGGTSPSGQSYLESAETDEIKMLLQ